MITEQDLQAAIAECNGTRNPNRDTCMMLAAFYTIQDHLYPQNQSADVGKTIEPSFSFAPPPTETVTSGTVGDYGESDFLQAVRDMDEADAWGVMDELMDTLLVINRRLYDGVMGKLNM